MKFGKSHKGVSRTLLLSFVGLGIVVVLAFALRVPTMFAQLLYTVCHHISLVRRRLMQRPGNSARRASALATTSPERG